MKKEEYEAGRRRLEAAGQRTLEIYKHVGCLSTHFAGLEIELLQLLAKLINPTDSARAERSLSQMSFRQNLEAFKHTVSELFLNPQVVKEANALAGRIGQIALRRNEIVHSSWIAYTAGDFGQHRARAKGKNPLGHVAHTADPVKMIDELTNDVADMIFDLACFENHIDQDERHAGQIFSEAAPSAAPNESSALALAARGIAKRGESNGRN